MHNISWSLNIFQLKYTALCSYYVLIDLKHIRNQNVNMSGWTIFLWSSTLHMHCVYLNDISRVTFLIKRVYQLSYQNLRIVKLDKYAILHYFFLMVFLSRIRINVLFCSSFAKVEWCSTSYRHLLNTSNLVMSEHSIEKRGVLLFQWSLLVNKFTLASISLFSWSLLLCLHV